MTTKTNTNGKEEMMGMIVTGNLGWNGQKMTTNREEWVVLTEEGRQVEVEKIHNHPWYCGFKLYTSEVR